MKKLGIIGATGMVGSAILNCLLKERLLDKFELFMFVSDKSAGKVLVFNEKHYPLFKLDDDLINFHLDYAIFLTGEDVSLVWVEKFVKTGVKVIDNSCAFRLCDGVPLIVPEINIGIMKEDDKIVANPNCSTIQLVVVLDRLLKLSKIKKVVVSSYQSVSGAGRDALLDLQNQTKNYFDCGIVDNIIPQIGALEVNGNSKEENKIINETKKILDCNFDVFATAVRVPISYCHGESVFVEFENDVDLAEVKSALTCDYIKLSDDLFYPTECVNSNDTFVCRLRKMGKNVIQMFIVADNLRRGAAYNAIKILEYIAKN